MSVLTGTVRGDAVRTVDPQVDRCQTCRFWCATDPQTNAGLPEFATGQCRFDSPAPFSTECTSVAIRNAVWPTTFGQHDWCGRYDPR